MKHAKKKKNKIKKNSNLINNCEQNPNLKLKHEQ